MPNDDRLHARVADNSARIKNLEDEVGRLRERQHEMATELAAIRFLGQKVSDLATELHELGLQLDRFSRRAVERPTSAGWSALAGWTAVLLAFVALVVAARGGR